MDLNTWEKQSPNAFRNLCFKKFVPLFHHLINRRFDCLKRHGSWDQAHFSSFGVEQYVSRRSGNSCLGSADHIFCNVFLKTSAVETFFKCRFGKPLFDSQWHEFIQCKSGAVGCGPLVDSIQIFPKCIIASQCIGALGSFSLFLGVRMKRQRKMPVYPHHPAVIRIHHLPCSRMKPLAERTLYIGVFYKCDRSIAVTSDVIIFGDLRDIFRFLRRWRLS